MEEIRDYYAFLGVPHNASADDIKRAYVRKGREFQNDVDKSSQLSQAYEVLCDAEKKKQYDLNMKFGKQVDSIKEKIHNSETYEQREKYLIEAREIYLNILEADSENIDALWNLAALEELLGNEDEAVEYLEQLKNYVDEYDKLEVCHRLGEIYKRQEKTDEAIKCFEVIYRANISYEDNEYVEDIKTLVRFYYEEKKNIRIAIQMLNDCINRTDDTRLKIIYLCETLRAIRTLENSSYQKVEETLYKKLESFRTDDEQQNIVNIASMVTCLDDVIEREDFECFHRLEKIYVMYNIEGEKLNQAFEALRQMVYAMEKGYVHEAIDLYFEEEWTKEIKEKLSRFIVNEAEKIKESLDRIKTEAPLYWNHEKEFLDLEKIVDDNLAISKEFNSLVKDRSISFQMKIMMKCILLNIFIPYDDLKDEFIDARDSFFEKEDEGLAEHTLRKMEEFYPLCYKRFSEIFFEEKNTEELNVSKSEREAKVVNNHNTDIEEKKDDSSFSYGILGLLAFPFILVIGILATIFSDNKEEKVIDAEELARKEAEERRKKEEKEQKQKERKAKTKKVIKWIIVIFIIMGILSIIPVALEYYEIKQQEIYEETHNGLLNEDEWKQVEKITDKYDEIVDVDICVVQENPNYVENYPEGNCIWLILWDYGYRAEYELLSNYLSEYEKEALYQEISDLYDRDYTDFEKCERFYELALEYVENHKDNYIVVPDMIGNDFNTAVIKAEKMGFKVEVNENVYSDTYIKNAIVYQDVYAGNEIQKGGTVFVDVSQGIDDRVEVPFLIGESYDEIKKSGLELSVLEQVYSDEYDAGIIIAQNIPAGTKLNDGDSIGVTISLGEKVPANISADEYFDLQRSVSQMDSISYESVLEMIGINSALCTINIGKNENNNDRYLVSFPAVFIGIKGTTTLEISYSDENKPYINIEWLSSDESALVEVSDLLYKQGYTEVLEQREYGLVYDGYESENGRIRFFRRSVNNQYRCLLKFVAY